MTVQVWTARLSYGGPDRLDVTRGGADRARKLLGLVRGEVSPGEPFAPTWPIVRAGKGGRISWEKYVSEYKKEMEQSRTNVWPNAWVELLKRDEVTLCCYCVDPQRCHRTLLAAMLGELGAEVRGER